MSGPGWTITDRERELFAAYSGDHNPIHTDPVAARRLIGGRLLVHGAHVVLAVLDRAVASRRLDAVPDHVDVTFMRGVAPGAALATSFERHGSQLRASVAADGVRAVDLTIAEGHRAPVDRKLPPTEVATPAHHSIEDLVGVHGEFALAGEERIARELFPDAVELLGSLRVAELAALSRVVGMRAPGLYSMSSRYEITLADPTSPDATVVAYAVGDVDPRMRRVGMDVSGPTQRARITAFAVPEPVEQRERVDVDQVEAGEFAGWRALVVGGSRGLGAAAVRLLTAGTADVRFTYHVGGREAAELSHDTGAIPVRFDARGAAAPPVPPDWPVTHLAWFAAPQSGDDSAVAVEVDAFAAAVDALAPSLRAVLWPSCASADRVKPIGEQRCIQLAALYPDVIVHAPRLPVVATDRTATLLPTDYADTTEVVLGALRALSG